jgi:hypothetical protein
MATHEAKEGTQGGGEEGSIVESNYVGQLVEVGRLRGEQGGEKALSNACSSGYRAIKAERGGPFIGSRQRSMAAYRDPRANAT